jgi:hypothetical protein
MKWGISIEILYVRHTAPLVHLIDMRPEIVKISLLDLSQPFYVEDLQKHIVVAVPNYTFLTVGRFSLN